MEHLHKLTIKVPYWFLVVWRGSLYLRDQLNYCSNVFVASPVGSRKSQRMRQGVTCKILFSIRNIMTADGIAKIMKSKVGFFRRVHFPLLREPPFARGSDP